jgi:SAM-dependent methyltransferase
MYRFMPVRTAEQTKAWVENQYSNPDPWGYQRTKDDAFRKGKMIAACTLLAPLGGFKNALDIGAGEGWITKDLPATEKCGLELSDNGASRFPMEVMRVADFNDGIFDLVISTETMFEHYDWKAIRDTILRACAPGGIIVTSNNTKWEVPALVKALGEPLLQWEYPYKGMVMSLKAWRR